MKMQGYEFNRQLEVLLKCEVRAFGRREKLECISDALGSSGKFQSTESWKRLAGKRTLTGCEFKRAVSDLMAAHVDHMDDLRKKATAKKILFGA